jgi:GNAT superfamily N-acetyltransferase
VTGTYQQPVVLRAEHELDGFECRSAEQAEWLRRHARQSSSFGTTRVLVVTAGDSNVVVAYYAWCMASVSLADARTRVRKGAGRYPQPVALLARLGVDVAHEGRGVGAGLIQDVIARTHVLGEEIGCRGLLVHAETTEARDFYLHLVPEFAASPTDELHLFLLMKDIRRTLS